MIHLLEYQPTLLSDEESLPIQIKMFPRFRYMGSKYRLISWIHQTLRELKFITAVDAFSGSGVVSYLLKAMGKRVLSNDSLLFPSTLCSAMIANSATQLTAEDIDQIVSAKATGRDHTFIRQTFEGIFYTPAELDFLDNFWAGVRNISSPMKRALALAAILRSAVKRQPRGLFTVAGDMEHYKDGRRDLKLTLREHFIEQASIYNRAVFSNGKKNASSHGDVFSINVGSDLVYLDPPYVPRSDDNCYVKRYHFLEGLACYWEGQDILMNSKVRKIVKPFTPFAYRKTALEAFDRLFRHFADSILVLSYSSNAYPDLASLRTIMKRYKRTVHVLEREHRYHFGNHEAALRNAVQEYLIIGSS